MIKIAWSAVYDHPLPVGHRFPMEKYSLLPRQLLYEGTIEANCLYEPAPLPESLILSTHEATYWQRLQGLQLDRQEQRRSGFPHSAELIHREIVIANGTVQNCHHALKAGVAMNVAGGTHHAFTNKGEGFCLLNDIAIAANYVLSQGLAKQVLVVDLDVHQGNGTAQIFQHNPRVFTFSMHGARNYPMHKEQSDLDVPLADGTDDDTYLALLQQHLPQLIAHMQPDFMFYQCGVDVLGTDKLGKLGLSLAGCKARDHLVLSTACQHEIPIVCVMGGGYSEKLSTIIEAHANTYRLAVELFT